MDGRKKLKYMKYLTIYLYIQFVCCLVSDLKGQETPLSLADCIHRHATNPALKKEELQINRADLRYKQAKYDHRLPRVEAGADHAISQGRSIDPHQPIYR